MSHDKPQKAVALQGTPEEIAADIPPPRPLTPEEEEAFRDKTLTEADKRAYLTIREKLDQAMQAVSGQSAEGDSDG